MQTGTSEASYLSPPLPTHSVTEPPPPPTLSTVPAGRLQQQRVNGLIARTRRVDPARSTGPPGLCARSNPEPCGPGLIRAFHLSLKVLIRPPRRLTAHPPSSPPHLKPHRVAGLRDPPDSVHALTRSPVDLVSSARRRPLKTRIRPPRRLTAHPPSSPAPHSPRLVLPPSLTRRYEKGARHLPPSSPLRQGSFRTPQTLRTL